jgi:acyl-coenzyme A synthetase/AMP-(fatty) acid ligase
MTGNSLNLLWMTALLMIGAVIALVGGMLIARRLRSRAADSTPAAAFTLQDLRRLRDSGQISEVEFESMRAAMIGNLRSPRPSDTES